MTDHHLPVIKYFPQILVEYHSLVQQRVQHREPEVLVCRITELDVIDEHLFRDVWKAMCIVPREANHLLARIRVFEYEMLSSCIGVDLIHRQLLDIPTLPIAILTHSDLRR